MAGHEIEEGGLIAFTGEVLTLGTSSDYTTMATDVIRLHMFTKVGGKFGTNSVSRGFFVVLQNITQSEINE